MEEGERREKKGEGKIGKSKRPERETDDARVSSCVSIGVA